MQRGITQTGALGRTSPSGGGGGIVGGDGMALSGMTNAAALAEQVAFQDPTEPGGASGPSGNSGDGGLILYWFEQFGNDLADLFGGGGGSSLPPNYYVFQHRINRSHGGRHPLYTDIIGMPTDIVVDQHRPHCLCGDPHPCKKSPLHKNEGPEYRRAPTPTPTATPNAVDRQISTYFCIGFAAAFNPGPFVGCPVGLGGCYWEKNPEAYAQAASSCSVLGGILVLCSYSASRGGR